jgi:hypothetical protein
MSSIASAKYGADNVNLWLDVTDHLIALVISPSGCKSLNVTNETFGCDPVPGQVKQLLVALKDGSCRSFQEGAIADLSWTEEKTPITINSIYDTKEATTTLIAAVNLVDSSPISLACLVHVGYNDQKLCHETLQYVQRVKDVCEAENINCDLFVTVHDENMLKWMTSEYMTDKEDVRARGGSETLKKEERIMVKHIALIPNRGVDILAFLRGMAHPQMVNWSSSPYSHVVKMHTKRIDAWRRGLTKGLMDSEASVRTLLEMIRNPSIGMVGAYSLPKCTHSTEDNVAKMAVTDLNWFASTEDALKAIERSFFSAGTVFCTRVDMMYSAFKTLDVENETALVGEGRYYALQNNYETRLHWMERLFGLACVWSGKTYVSVGPGFMN